MTFFTAKTVFYYLAAASVASALVAVTRRNPVHAVLWVLALFLHVAGIFLVLGAEFLAAVQTIVYAGAILIFYLFVLMLVDVLDEESGPRFGPHWALAAVAATSFAAMICLAQSVSPDLRDGHAKMAKTVGPDLRDGHANPGAAVATRGVEDPPLGSLANVGLSLFGPFALPFEIAGLVLLAAIVGAVVLAGRRGAS